ncbi:protein of unknown function [Cupriavidus neocaledonicus]|uniref:Uncharacterized protein n=1 Tax=Cupriavidus neocaledonicus TaxID=1040979 RepID=A0A375H8X0_9BURK|nr:hypothetical protein CBM2605_A140102 [Cupriavidus neocaledonicus]SPD46650.1 protein of unknown function [Cupriavidus neocaledonicus]
MSDVAASQSRKPHESNHAAVPNVLQCTSRARRLSEKLLAEVTTGAAANRGCALGYVSSNDDFALGLGASHFGAIV